jgi:hypothetical protein
MDREKYYTPDITEFHVGFEYEKSEYGRKIWTKEVFEFDFGSGNEILDIYNEGYDTTHLRVKYLDQKDIESLGFTKRLKNDWVGYNDYILSSISGEYGYFLKATLHIPKMDDMYKIYVYRHLDDIDRIENYLSCGNSLQVFNGKIKNKSELKVLLKQLNIINGEI